MSESDGTNDQNSYLNYFSGLYHRNKKLLMVSFSIYFLSVAAGILMAMFLSGPVNSYLTTMVQTDRQFLSEKGFNFLTIFSHNLFSLFLTFAGGVTAIITVILIIINGFIYGAFLGYVASNPVIGGQASSIGSLTPLKFIVYTVPHGIFEISGFIIAGAAGLRLSTIIIDIIRKDEEKNYYYAKIKDALALFGIAAVLIFIAAIIETSVTIHIGNFIFQHI
ncbi:MAG: stage II sporulation protein M [Methanobacterium sp.]|nr:stage II sporulation protein M [Methanobacterium sp.]